MWHRKPVVAGSFYPGNPVELGREIDQYLFDAGSKKVSKKIMGLISPHAGYVYSGPVAAYSFRELKDEKIDVVVVIAPSHRARFRGASIIPDGIFETPLGNVTIDTMLGQKIIQKELFDFVKEVHQYEHSLEVQVPFLQRVIPECTLVPIVVGTTDLSICRVLAKGITEVLIDETRSYIIVISTDLSHYYSYSAAKNLDAAFIDSLRAFDEDEIKRTIDSGKAEACGEGPVLTGVMACKSLGAKGVEILKYANSGDTAGSKDQVVGYLAAAIVK